MNDISTSRKRIRVRNYDYSQNGGYFVTICAHNRSNLFGSITQSVGQELCTCHLTPLGEIVQEQWYAMEKRYAAVKVDKFIVMPNHVHGIVIIDNIQQGQDCPTTSLFDVMRTYKSITTKLCNQHNHILRQKIWQPRYHDRIIRDENEYQKLWEYIDNNPLKWELDRYFECPM